MCSSQPSERCAGSEPPPRAPFSPHCKCVSTVEDPTASSACTPVAQFQEKWAGESHFSHDTCVFLWAVCNCSATQKYRWSTLGLSIILTVDESPCSCVTSQTTYGLRESRREEMSRCGFQPLHTEGSIRGLELEFLIFLLLWIPGSKSSVLCHITHHGFWYKCQSIRIRDSRDLVSSGSRTGASSQAPLWYAQGPKERGTCFQSAQHDTSPFETCCPNYQQS